MRITRDALLKVVQETVSRRTRSDRGVISIYLCGSFLNDDYLLGGVGDIDLVFIHTDTVSAEREIVPVTDEIHFDIAHHLHRDYRQPRRLRVHPWLGPTIYRCKILHDPQHFMNFAQAGVRGQFSRSDFVLERSRKQAEHARQIWRSYHHSQTEATPRDISNYLRAIEHAANAIALLNGPPLTERRLLLNLPSRAEKLGRPGLHAGLLGLLGAPNANREKFQSWMAAWEAAYRAIQDDAPARLHPERLVYYRRAFEAILAGEQPEAMLWPLLRTWTIAINCLPDGAESRQIYSQASERLGLWGAGFNEKISALDAYLDLVEETLDEWGKANGVFLG